MIVELRWKRIELSQFLPAAAALGGYGVASPGIEKIKNNPKNPACPVKFFSKKRSEADLTGVNPVKK